MTILSLQMDFAGQAGVYPRTGKMVTNDSLAAITAPGYLNSFNGGHSFMHGDFVFVDYAGGQSLFSLTYSGEIITLEAQSTDIVLPTVAGDLAKFSNVTGTLEDSGIIAANVVVHGSALVSGNLVAGSAAGAIADTGLATTDLVTHTTALVNGNVVSASAAGIVEDSTFAVADLMSLSAINTMNTGSSIIAFKANGTESANAVTADGMAGRITTSALNTGAGSNYSFAWTNSSITSTSVVLLQISGGTNNGTTAINLVITPATGSATVVIYNNDGANSMNGTLWIDYLVI